MYHTVHLPLLHVTCTLILHAHLVYHTVHLPLLHVTCTLIPHAHLSTIETSVTRLCMHRGPECFEPGRKLTDKADIWALGCMLLEMCSGSVFPAGTSSAVIVAQLATQRKGPKIPDNVPKHLAAIIQLCLQPETQNRPTASQVQQARLSRICTLTFTEQSCI